jgi:transcriptional regulator of acetoin/glycerol metabolism
MVERGVILAKNDTITMAELPRDMVHSTDVAGDSIEEIVRNHILKVLEETKGNVTKAADILGIQRMTLYNKLKKYDYKLNGSGS